MTLDLYRIGRTVADIHVARLAEPKNHVSINFRSRTRIEERMDVNLTDISGAAVAIGLVREAIGRACVVGSLSSESGGRQHVGRAGTAQGRNSQDQNCNRKMLLKHGSSGAE